MRRRSIFATLALAASSLTVLVASSITTAAGPGGWDHLGSAGGGNGAMNDRVLALNSELPGQLIAGGTFTDAGGNSNADYIATYNGTAWSNLGPGSGLNGAVNAIAVHNGRVIAGGQFTNAGGNPDNDYIAMWNGSSWQPMCTSAPPPTFNAGVLSLEVVGSTLFVGGSFLNVNGNPAGDQLVSCNLTTGGLIGPLVDADPDLDGPINAIAADGSGGIYVGGNFINLDGIPAADYVARFSGSWSALGSGGGPSGGAIDTVGVDSLAVSGTTLYVGTDDQDVAGIPQADNVVRWNGSAWSAVGAGPGGDGFFPAGAAINGLLVLGSDVYATGAFLNAGGNALADNVAVFSGGNWSNLGSNGAGNGPWIGPGFALAAYGGSPVAGGNFTNAGGDPLADRLATYPLAGPAPVPARPALRRKPRKRIVTRKRRVRVKFAFGAPNAASFVCKLDRKPFRRCASPKTYRVGPGRHKFAVCGVNADGTRGPAARASFRVIRRR